MENETWWEEHVVPCINHKGGFDAEKLHQAIAKVRREAASEAVQRCKEAVIRTPAIAMPGGGQIQYKDDAILAIEAEINGEGKV